MITCILLRYVTMKSSYNKGFFFNIKVLIYKNQVKLCVATEAYYQHVGADNNFKGYDQNHDSFKSSSSEV